MKTMNVLPVEEVKYVKIISFDVEVDGESCPALIVYKRNPSKDYTMDDSKRLDTDRMLYYYPEECYPKDAVDEVILGAIKEVCPGARVSTSLMLCDIEKENLEKFLSTYSKHCYMIVILPHIKDQDSVLRSGKTSWPIFEKELPLYVHLRKHNNEYIRNISTIYYDVENEDRMIEMEPTLLNEVLQ